jgi:hypothetical protein
VLIFLATLVYRIFDQYFTKQIETIIRSQNGISSIIWLWGSLSLLSAILFPVITTMICAYALKNNSVKKIFIFFSQHLELSVLETVRAWGMFYLTQTMLQAVLTL